nr:hypothetical protein [Neobacillus drentensis]
MENIWKQDYLFEIAFWAITIILIIKMRLKSGTINCCIIGNVIYSDIFEILFIS